MTPPQSFANNGFLYVATVNKAFLNAARNSAESLKDFFPEAHITLFTHEEWVEECDADIFDNIVTDNVPRHIRAKLWALSQTPYNLTLYIDCDTEIRHSDIQQIFTLIPEDIDLLFTKIRPYNAKITKLSNTEEMTHHCGLFLYRKNPHTMALMNSWYGEFLKQEKYTKEDMGDYPIDAKKWDTFTMWRLLTYGNTGVNVGWFPEPDARWNFVWGYRLEELQNTDIVIFHYTIPQTIMEKYK